MIPGDSHLRHLEAALWVLTGAVAIAVTGCVLSGYFTLDLPSFLAPVTAVSGLAAGGWFYRSVRHENRIGAILVSTALLIGFAAVAAPLSYVAATSGFPLQDALLDGWDRELGFDWVAMVTLVARHPQLQQILLYAYSSFAVQIVTTLVVLGVTGQLARLNTFVIAFFATTLITIAVSAVVPAEGPWLFLDMQPASTNGFVPVTSSSWPEFLGLRDGTLRELHGLRSEGIITFPSLHAAFAVLFAAALWGVSGVRWIGLAVNGAMLIATPVFGSHYLVDVIAGIALVAVCWLAAERLVTAAGRKFAPDFPIVAGSPPIVPDATAPQPATMAPREAESAARPVAEA